MSKAQELIAGTRNNSRDVWSIDDLKTQAVRNGIAWRQPGTSHVTFSYPGVTPLTVPAQKPIKAVYLRRFLELIDRVGENDDE